MKEKILQMVDSFWKFDNHQQPISSWHDKQDLLKALEEFKLMIIEIGNKPLKEMTAQDLLQIVIIEGCCPVIMHNGEKIWNEPVITDFDNKMFSDTLVLDYTSFRVSDNMKSANYVFFFNWNDFNWHYSKYYEQNKNLNPKRVCFETIKYLIAQGYDVPLYNNA